MAVTHFPDPEDAVISPEGLIAVGGDLEPETLLEAYSKGIYPWPSPGYPLLWFCPPQRAILEFDRLHIPRSLERARRRAPYRITVNQAFPEVIRECARVPRPGQDGTWITRQMIPAYIRLHELGHALSVEAWEGDALVGGIYGVDAGGPFAGESMFFRRPDASKLALLHLVDLLRARGLEWLDIQMLTPHMERLGAREISREEFLELLRRTRKRLQ